MELVHPVHSDDPARAGPALGNARAPRVTARMAIALMRRIRIRRGTVPAGGDPVKRPGPTSTAGRCAHAPETGGPTRVSGTGEGDLDHAADDANGVVAETADPR